MTAAAAVAALGSLSSSRPVRWALPVPVGVPEWLKLSGDLALKGALLLALAFVIAALLRRAAAAVRHLVWCCAFAGLLLLPALELLLPSWRVKVVAPAVLRGPAWQIRPAEVAPAPVPPRGNRADNRELAPTPATGVASATAESPGASPSAAASTVAPLSEPPAGVVPRIAIGPVFITQRQFGWIGVSLLAIATALLGRVAVAHLAARLLVWRARDGADEGWTRLLDSCRGEIGLRRTVGLRVSAERTMPLTTGVVRPVLLLPSDAVEWPGGRRRVVLLHELAHVRRWDCLTQLLAQVATALNWYNPLAWLAARRLLAEQERACDDLVLARGGARPSDYAGHLLSITQSLAPRGGLRLAAVGMARPSQLEGRLLAVLDPKRSRGAPGAWAKLAAAVTLAGALIPLASVRLTRAEATPPAKAAGTWTDPAVARPQKLVATLPDGVTIELLGVSEHPSKDKPWWSPAGVPLPDRFVSDVSSVHVDQPDDSTRTREFVVRLSGVPKGASDPRWASPDLNLNYTADEARRADGPKGTDKEPAGSRFRAMVAALPASSRTLNLRVGIATGPWKTVAESPSAGPATRPVRETPTEEERRALQGRLDVLDSELNQPLSGMRMSWNASQYELDQLVQEQARILKDLPSLKTRYDALIFDMAEGRTPWEIEKQIQNNLSYQQARQRRDNTDVELASLIDQRGPKHDAVAKLRQRRKLDQRSLDETREKLEGIYRESLKASLKRDLDQAPDDLERIDQAIRQTSERLVRLNGLFEEYRSTSARLQGHSSNVTFGTPTPHDHIVEIAATHEIADQDVRLVAVNAESREVFPASCGTERRRTTATFKLTLDQVTAVRLQTRPYRWVEFRDVALEPVGGNASSGDASRDKYAAGHPRRQDVETSEDVIRAFSEELVRTAKSLEDERENLRMAEQALQQADADKRLYAPEDWARVDETMKTHVNMRNELQLRVESLETQLGSAHQAVIRAKEDLTARQRYMDGYAQLLNAKYIIRWKEGGTGGVLIPRDLAGLRESVARLNKSYEEMSKKVQEMRAAAAAESGGGGDPVLTARRLAQLKLEGELREARVQLAEAKREIAAADKQTNADDFARVDERAKELLHQRDEIRSRRDELEPQLGADSAVVRRLDSNLERAEAQWREYGAELAKRFYVHWDLGGKGPSLVPRDQSALEAKVQRLAREMEESQKRLESDTAGKK